jgi:hypothetical protein
MRGIRFGIRAVCGAFLLLLLVVLPVEATVNSIETPDTVGGVGHGPSIVLDSSGNPVISYYDITNQDLRVLHCDDPNCAGIETPASPDAAGSVGSDSSLALDASGYPVISYYDNTNQDLKVMHCNDPACVGGDESIVSPDTAGSVGEDTSLVLDAVGNPVISYRDSTNFDLKVLHCDDPACAGAETPQSPVTFGFAGFATSIALDSAGNPVVSFGIVPGVGESDLGLLHCGTPDCSAGNSIEIPMTSGDTGHATSLVLDAAGNPVVSFVSDYLTDGELWLMHCIDVNCDSRTIKSLSPNRRIGTATSVKLDASGFPVIAFFDQGPNVCCDVDRAPRVIHCDDVNCDGVESSTSPDPASDTGASLSMTLDALGYPVVAYYDYTNGDLKVLHCGDPKCITDPDEDNVDVGVDNCLAISNPGQENSDANFVDTSPPYVVAIDDKTWPNSDILGDACDADDDNDGITDADETTGAACGGIITNPLLFDTDGDQARDGAECALGTNPTSAASEPLLTACGAAGDADGDKIATRIEFCYYGTNTASVDSDGDAVGGLDGDGGRDGCEIASINGDQVVSSGDQGKLASGISGSTPYHAGVDINKDGLLNSGDQGTMASFISPPGQCPG